ncbi:DUF4097 domain-containing protein [Shewanella sp. A25]|nr:DUF4097 domain-containing protein [Shewanella shenzhenensis]
MSIKSLLPIASLGLLAAGAASLSGCIINVNASEDAPDITPVHKELTLDSQGLQSLIAETGAGGLEIVGIEGLSQIKLVADIYADESSEVILTLEKSGSNAKLKAEIKPYSSFNNYSPYIDLTLQVPAAMALDIDDGSGEIVITKMMGNIDVKDGSGGLSIEGGHNVSIDDGSGEIEVSNLFGTLSINDGSGGIKVTKVQGNTTIQDGSGEIEASDIIGSLSIVDGSGSITAKNIQGSVTIEDGSGEIEVRDVKNAVTITDGSGDINVFNTQGLTVLEAGSGQIHFDQINGAVTVK